MILTSLELTGYRNYRSLSCDFCPGINLISGANAQGKTNLIESVHYLSIGKAYRQARDDQLILWGGQSFSIKGRVERKQGKTEIEVRYRQEENPAKTVWANGLRLTSRENLSGMLTSVLFSPESMTILKGPPRERREFLNYDISQISLTYSTNLARYMRILAQRNALLKKLGAVSASEAEKRERLSVWDQQLIFYGSRIIEKRMSIVEKLIPLVRLTHRKLTDDNDNMELYYVPHAKDNIMIKKNSEGKWDVESFLREAGAASFDYDVRYGSTRWGPHLDDIRVLLDGVDIRQYGSQGQQRTGVLALKLAELEIFRGESGEYPVLLLDDVLSELDEKRQRKLLEFINEKYIQCIITATESKNINLIVKRQAKSFFVNRGEIKEQ